MDTVEIFAKLLGKNEVVNKTTMAVLAQLAEIEKFLISISQALPREKDTDIHLSPNLPSKHSDKLNVFMQQIKGILPVTYSLLIPQNVTKKNGLVDQIAVPSIPHTATDTEKFWILSVYYHAQNMLNVERSCYKNWTCRFQKAADILHKIWNLNLQTFRDNSVQSVDELLLR